MGAFCDCDNLQGSEIVLLPGLLVGLPAQCKCSVCPGFTTPFAFCFSS